MKNECVTAARKHGHRGDADKLHYAGHKDVCSMIPKTLFKDFCRKMCQFQFGLRVQTGNGKATCLIK